MNTLRPKYCLFYSPILTQGFPKEIHSFIIEWATDSLAELDFQPINLEENIKHFLSFSKIAATSSLPPRKTLIYLFVNNK
jgi:hypothetical protein